MIILHSVDTCSELQWAFALNSEKDDYETAYLLAILEMPLQIEAELLTHKAYNFTCQVTVERTNKTLKEMHIEENWV